jgi:hypothetical protein
MNALRFWLPLLFAIYAAVAVLGKTGSYRFAGLVMGVWFLTYVLTGG